MVVVDRRALREREVVAIAVVGVEAEQGEVRTLDQPGQPLGDGGLPAAAAAGHADEEGARDRSPSTGMRSWADTDLGRSVT